MNTIMLKEMWNMLFEGIVLADQDGYLLDMNRTAKRIFSISTSSMEGTSIFELLPESLKKRAIPQKETTGINLTFGTEELLLNIKPVEGNFLYIFKNISQEHLFKLEIKEKRKELNSFHQIIDQLSEGICAIDQDGKIILYNKKMGEIDAREPDTVRNKLWTAAFPDTDKNSSKLLKTLQLGKKLNQRETKFTSDGKALITLSNTLPLYNGSQPLGAVQIDKDITNQKHLEDTILNMKQNSSEQPKKNQDRKNNTDFHFNHIIHRSTEMELTIEQAKRASRTPSNVLLIGETGTGKELFAQSIHNESPRQDNKFIAQNCAAVPESLLEGMLFGTTAGSFTGAIDRPGIFEQADNGTLLLDEINSMGPDLQAKLLRFIQDKKVQRIGSKKTIGTDVRIIATINEDPHKAIKEKRLREDLFYRLSVVNLEIPPLRSRKDDISLLIEGLVDKHSKILNIEINDIDPEVMDFLLSYHWPGNVRQLEHTIEGALNLIDDEKKISTHHLPLFFKNGMIKTNESYHSDDNSLLTSHGTLEEQKAMLERKLIDEAIKKADGNITNAGKILGISRQNLNYKMKKFGF
ncbi:sigma 54-interacting transcriptional regulator [Virgibacillus sp. C22-A2]|uniref:Sigma 54-interacting transcriptional regulator n=1 Tax=Virgibacillus tibetensis TaxID=3042313 RepID=A0ABU6KD30_9BACI|nr:sigma 54-interacting transcriptional regulator [Virgibacillus sp. C22-A2]